MHHSPLAIRCALLLTAIAATNETFGDTVPGVPKKLRVETASVTGKR